MRQVTVVTVLKTKEARYRNVTAREEGEVLGAAHLQQQHLFFHDQNWRPRPTDGIPVKSSTTQRQTRMCEGGVRQW